MSQRNIDPASSLPQKKAGLAPELQSDINKMSLSDLYCHKFRIVHHLSNNHSGYNFIKISKKPTQLEEDEEDNTQKGPFQQGRSQKEKIFKQGFDNQNGNVDTVCLPLTVFKLKINF